MRKRNHSGIKKVEFARPNSEGMQRRSSLPRAVVFRAAEADVCEAKTESSMQIKKKQNQTFNYWLGCVLFAFGTITEGQEGGQDAVEVDTETLNSSFLVNTLLCNNCLVKTVKNFCVFSCERRLFFKSIKPGISSKTLSSVFSCGSLPCGHAVFTSFTVC